MSRGLFFIVVIACIVTAISAFLLRVPASDRLPILGQLPHFSFLAKERIVQDFDLTGRVALLHVAPIQCGTTCLTISSKLAGYLRSAGDAPDFRIVKVVVENSEDQQDPMTEAALVLRADTSSFKKFEDWLKSLEPSATSSSIILLDRQGQVRRVYDSTSQDLFQKISADLLALKALPN